MGIYSTTTSLQVVMIGTTFDSLTTSLAQTCITWSESEINKYLSKRYDLSSSPFNTTTTIPPIVKMWSDRLSAGYVYESLARGSKEGYQRASRYIDSVIENLALVSEFKLDILNSAGSVVADMSNTSYRCLSSTDTYSNTFNEDTVTSWTPDQDKLDDISDERDS